jgi:hypothetical protein
LHSVRSEALLLVEADTGKVVALAQRELAA